MYLLSKRPRTAVFNSRSAFTAVSLVALLSSVAHSEEAEQNTDPAKGSTNTLEHIIVRGEKIERSYLDTFSSVGIVTAEDFKQYDIGDTTEAFRRLANVRSVPQAGGNSIQIRGLAADGVTQPQNSATLISVVIDGVTQGAEALRRGSRGVWDIDQLEVYRGPQSTIQGRNALAGTVVITTKDPTYEPELSLRGVYGELDRREGAFAVSGPILEDQLAFRVTGEYRESERDIELSDPDNKPFIEDKFYSLRGKLLYQPKQLEDLSVLFLVSDVFDAPSVAPVSGPDFFDRQFNSSAAFEEKREMDLNNYAINASYQLDDSLVFRSITGYHDADLDISSLPSDLGIVRDDTRKDQDFSQEFRLEKAEGDDRYSGTLGLFYSDEDGETDTFIAAGDLIIQEGIIKRKTETWAVFADLRYRILEDFSLIAGGRYQEDDLDRRSTSPSGPPTKRQANFDEFLPKTGLSWDLTEDQRLAITATKGFRRGFATTLINLDMEVEEYNVEPEFVWTYEIAYRLFALNGRLRLGANIFYNDYDDQQVEVLNPDISPTPFTLNAGDSEAYGAEFEANVNLGYGFTAYAALGLLDTELGAIPSDDCPGGSCDGNAYPQAPEVTASLGGAYEHDSGFFASISTSYTDDYFQEIENEPGIEVDDVFLVNLVAGYQYDHYRVSVYANNVFDEDYLTSVFSEDQASIGDGRAIGVELQADF